jgi:hypothetical protein
MSYTSGLNARQAAAEHVLAVSRDFISQPRLSEYRKLIIKFCEKFAIRKTPIAKKRPQFSSHLDSSHDVVNKQSKGKQ